MMRAIHCDILDLKMLIQKHAYRQGVFTLTSGRKSSFYVDMKKVALMPLGQYLIGNVICKTITSLTPNVQAVAGVELGAVPLVDATCLISQVRKFQCYCQKNFSLLPGILIRKKVKEHGTAGRLEIGAGTPSGVKVALLEDVVTTGGSVLNIGIPAMEEAGFSVEIILAIVDRQEGGREKIEKAGYKFHSIFTKKDIVK